MAVKLAERVVMNAADLPLYYNAVHILEHNLAERADKLALYSPQRTLTFRQVSQEANQIGNALARLGLEFGDVVGILAFDGPEWVTSFFGTLKLGAVALGMNTLLTPGEFAHILRDSRARVLVVQDKLLESIEPIRDKAEFLERVVVIGEPRRASDLRFADWIRAESTELRTVETHREDLATLNYSSGTTGEPKGIPHAHKDLPLCAQLWGANVLGLTEADRTFAVAKLFFTFGTGGNLIFPWYVGASVVLYPGPPRIASNVLEAIREFKPTVFYNAPTGYAAILAIEGFTEQYGLSSLRLCVSAGEALPAPIWENWKAQTGLDIIDGIGSTEVWHIFIS
ncbi:MAG: AMP-binding protein, partial [Anaerolineales bacterium]